MNCNDLETVALDLARGQMIDATLREEALSHAASCACCATRLADERALTAGLRRVAATGASEEARANVEAALLAAFRERHSTVTVPGLVSRRAAAQRWLYVAVGVAAVAVFVMLLSLTVSRTRDSQPRPTQSTGDASPSKPGLNDAPGDVVAQTAASPSSRESKTVRNQMKGSTTRATRAERLNRGADRRNQASGEIEIATDFIPLMNRESLPEMDSGQVVRVELPRSALMSFGLPMNMDRAAERIKADVVVGNDGLARAIRFVR